MKRTSPETIEFQKLHPYVFCDSYKVPKSSKGGKYQLTFTLAEGMFPMLLLPNQC